MSQPDASSRISDHFRARADSAAFWEAWVGSVLARSGLYTLHYPFLVDGKDHSETWDLEVDVSHPGDVVGTKVEVKSVNLTFTSPADYPFPNALVCSQSSWLKKWPGLNTVQRDFLIVSRLTGAIVWAPKGTPCDFGSEVLDKNRQELYKVVTCPKDRLRPLADFVEMICGT